MVKERRRRGEGGNDNLRKLAQLVLCIPWTDVNECDEADKCEVGEYCVNTAGSFKCRGEWSPALNQTTTSLSPHWSRYHLTGHVNSSLVTPTYYWSRQHLTGHDSTSLVTPTPHWSRQHLTGHANTSLVTTANHWSRQHLTGHANISLVTPTLHFSRQHLTAGHRAEFNSPFKRSAFWGQPLTFRSTVDTLSQ